MIGSGRVTGMPAPGAVLGAEADESVDSLGIIKRIGVMVQSGAADNPRT